MRSFSPGWTSWIATSSSTSGMAAEQRRRSTPTFSLMRNTLQSTAPAGPKLLGDLAEGAVPWAIPWPCIYEFLRVVTHPRVHHPPVPLSVALGELRRILASPTLVMLSETPNHPEVLMKVLNESGVTGNLAHDAHIAALCRSTG